MGVCICICRIERRRWKRRRGETERQRDMLLLYIVILGTRESVRETCPGYVVKECVTITIDRSVQLQLSF